MYELKKHGKVFTSKSVGTGPSSCEERIYRAAVWHRLRNTGLESRRVLFLSFRGILSHSRLKEQIIMDWDKSSWNGTNHNGIGQVIMEWDKLSWNGTNHQGMGQIIAEWDRSSWNGTNYHGMGWLIDTLQVAQLRDLTKYQTYFLNTFFYLPINSLQQSTIYV